MVYTHIKSVTVTVKNHKCGKVMCHRSKTRLYKGDF